MSFIAVAVSLLSAFGLLLWFTGWAEERVIDADSEPTEAKTT